MTISLPYLKKWQINIENSDNSLEIEEYFFSSVLTVRLLHSYFYLFRNFIFILPIVFLCKTTSNIYCQKYYYMFPTHTCGEYTLPWLGVFPLKSIRSHETCAHTLSNKCPGQLCNTLYTQHTVQYTIYEWKVSITTSLRKGIIGVRKWHSSPLKGSSEEALLSWGQPSTHN